MATSTKLNFEIPISYGVLIDDTFVFCLLVLLAIQTLI